MTDITLVLPSVASSLVNVGYSSMGGEAWLSLGADGTFQMALDVDVDVRIGVCPSES